MLNAQQVDEAAGALMAVHKGKPIKPIPALSDALKPQSETDCYAIQDAVLKGLGETVGGWKVGFLEPGNVYCAPIYASKIHASPAALPAAGFNVIGIECEIGFRVNQPLPYRSAPYSRTEVLASVTMHPTIEVVDSRYVDFRSLDRLHILADNYSNGGLVFGAAASGWENADLVHPPIEVTADGKHFADCTGLRASDPISMLLALVNFVSKHRGGCPAGIFVTTGTHTGLILTEPGVKIAADYGPFGHVEVSFPR
ncbi:MAG TPA: 2-keto-4-pentenoate hydratase [Stellaceae bacterium]|jgi:2-keto-4-pentenoate hydratase|nr:2-keto-4-pentenoate hydratase [Stellaceae bacterium]